MCTSSTAPVPEQNIQSQEASQDDQFMDALSVTSEGYQSQDTPEIISEELPRPPAPAPSSPNVIDLTMELDEDSDSESESSNAEWNCSPEPTRWVSWQTESDNTWSSKWSRYKDQREPWALDDQIEMQANLTPTDQKPGILAYGPFNQLTIHPNPVYHDYWIYIHETDLYDVLDYIAYGGPAYKDGKTVTLFKLPISPFVEDPSLDYVREYNIFLHHIEAFLHHPASYPGGIPIPSSLLQQSTKVRNGTGPPCHHYPLVERFLEVLSVPHVFRAESVGTAWIPIGNSGTQYHPNSREFVKSVRPDSDRNRVVPSGSDRNNSNKSLILIDHLI